MPSRVVIADYDPLWPGQFQRERERIEAILGRRALRNDADRNFYQRTKVVLAKPDWNDVQVYADAKTTVVSEIMTRALAGLS